MAIKTISQFDAAIPASDDKILFEQNGEGKSASIEDIVNTCSLTYEEITATNPVPDLTNKVASASALKSVNNKLNTIILISNSGKFPIGNNPRPYDNLQINCLARNERNGSLYTLWYSYPAKAFMVGAILSGSSPSDGDKVVVQYFSK